MGKHGLTNYLAFCSGVDVLLETVDALASGESEELVMQKLQPLPDFTPDGSRALQEYLLEHSQEYHDSLISVGRLLKVLVFPFLKLASCTSQEAGGPPSSSYTDRQKLMRCFYAGWMVALRLTLIPERCGLGQISSDSGALHPQKRKELVNAMIDAKIPEVCLNTT